LQSKTGGKGSVRRKTKNNRKTNTNDDKRLQNTLKRLQVNNIPAIEEVNLFKDNGTVIHFANPKVQASIAANTYVVSGHAETKNLQDLLPGIINQLGPDNLQNLKKIAESYNQKPGADAEDGSDDDDVPDLVVRAQHSCGGAAADGIGFFKKHGGRWGKRGHERMG
jgi:nascent polypeptide-associated complex subunit beta